MSRAAGTARFAYNWGFGASEEQYRNGGQSHGPITLKQQWNTSSTSVPLGGDGIKIATQQPFTIWKPLLAVLSSTQRISHL